MKTDHCPNRVERLEAADWRVNMLEPANWELADRTSLAEILSGKRRLGFWSTCGMRLLDWARQQPRQARIRRNQAGNMIGTTEAYSGLSDLINSGSASALQHIVDDSQARLDGRLVHELVDLALFKEKDPFAH